MAVACCSGSIRLLFCETVLVCALSDQRAYSCWDLLIDKLKTLLNAVPAVLGCKFDKPYYCL